MPQSDIFSPQRSFIDQPSCPKCGSAMWLACIEPDKSDHDLRTFECPTCKHTETKVVKFK